MIKGHLDQQRANLNSTKPTFPTAPPPLSANSTLLPSSPHVTLPPSSSTSTAETDASTTLDFRPPITSPPAVRTHHIYADFASSTGQIFTDLTGRFLQASSSGNSEMLVIYDYDSNFIHVEAMSSKSGPSILAAYTRAHTLLTSRGLKPALQRLDNEASAALQAFMTEAEVDFQLAPPHLHRRNAAERAIRTFKNHLIAGLCSTDRNFPLHLWDRLLPQALISLNLLRTSRLNPRLSAWAQVHGAFDYNRTPLAPPGTRVLIHEKPKVHETWAPHAVEGWYTGPALDHYRCYKVWATETSAERVADTLTWYPSQVSMPSTSSLDLATAAAQDLLAALLHPSDASPLPDLSLTQRAALFQLADIFATVTDSTSTDESTLLQPTSTVPSDIQPTATIVPRVITDSTPLQPAATVPSAPSPTTAVLPRVLDQIPPSRSASTNTPSNDNSHLSTTYTDCTGNPNQRRRKARAAQQLLLAPPPPVPVATPHPHNTRSTNRQRNSLNCAIATADLPDQMPSLVPSLPPSPSLHMAVVDPHTGATLEYPALLRGPDAAEWGHATALEIGRLTQGCLPHQSSGSNTMVFIPHTDKPADRVATYLRIVAELKPNKAEKRRVRFTVGGDKLTYEGNVSTPTADLTVVKTLLNSVVSTPGARFLTIDIKDFYLNTPMDVSEYMRIPVKYIPASIMSQYNLLPLIHNAHVMVEIRKGMYGLAQAGILANARLQSHLSASGFTAAPNTPGLFTHTSRPLTFSLVVDDFGIKYTSVDDADFLIQTLQQLYTITIDWSGALYCGLTLSWDYLQRTVDVSMPGYIERALSTFLHVPSARLQHSPHAWIPPSYGATVQYAQHDDISPPLDARALQHLQKVIDTLLYYARAVDSTMLVALGSLASVQTNGTAATTVAITQLLNYCAAHPSATLRYHACDMVLHAHSDASYLSEKHARSRSGGIFFLSSALPDPLRAPSPTSTPPPINGAVHVHSSIMSVVLFSATEAELGALFYNGKEAAMLRTILCDMGTHNPPLPSRQTTPVPPASQTAP